MTLVYLKLITKLNMLQYEMSWPPAQTDIWSTLTVGLTHKSHPGSDERNTNHYRRWHAPSEQCALRGIAQNNRTKKCEQMKKSFLKSVWSKTKIYISQNVLQIIRYRIIITFRSSTEVHYLVLNVNCDELFIYIHVYIHT